MNWLENIYKKYLKVSLFLNTEKIPKSRLHIHAFDLEEIANNSSNSSISLTNQSKSYFFFLLPIGSIFKHWKVFSFKSSIIDMISMLCFKSNFEIKKQNRFNVLVYNYTFFIGFLPGFLDLFYKEKRFLCILYSTNFKIIYKRITEFS